MEGILISFISSLLTIFITYSIFKRQNLIFRILRVVSVIVIIILVDSAKLFDITEYAVFSLIMIFFIELLFYQPVSVKKKDKPVIPGNEDIDIRFYSTPMFMTKIMILFTVLMYGEGAYPGGMEIPDHVYIFLGLPLLMLMADAIIGSVKKKKYSKNEHYYQNNRVKRLDHGASFVISALMGGFCVFSSVTNIE